jgi:type I restriction enzyme S subunit
MRTGAVTAREIAREGHRLTGGFHLAEDQQAMKLLNQLKDITPLIELTTGRRIFRGAIFKRIIVTDPRRGRPYVSARDLVQAEISPADYLSFRHGDLLNELELKEGMILVTCSGMNLGRAIWTRSDMDGLCASHDLIRIEPSSQDSTPGYVYAFLASRFGHVAIRRQIYGGNIKHIEPNQLEQLPVPRFGKAFERKVHALVVEAASLRAEASAVLAKAREDVARELDAPQVAPPGFSTNGVSFNAIRDTRRLDAFFHNQSAATLDAWAKRHPNGNWQLREVARVFDVPPFKHIYVEAGHGVPFFTSGDLFDLERTTDKYLSRTQTRDLRRYVLERGWVLLARSGQLGGIIGTPQFADSSLDKATTSDHVIRVVPRSDVVPPGYLFAYLSCRGIGYPLLTRTMTGASVPALWPMYLDNVAVVKASAAFMKKVDRVVQDAFERRVVAGEKDVAARRLVEDAIEKGATN